MSQPNIEPNPDFQRFRNTLLLTESYRRPPLFDFLIDGSHKARVLGRPIETAADDAAFMARAGYDYVQVSLYAPTDEIRRAAAAQQSEQSADSHGSDFHLIESLEQFRGKRWSWQPVAEGDLSVQQPKLDYLARAAEAVPDSMKLLIHVADTFTTAWEMIGFTEFCMATFDQPRLIREVMDSHGQATLNTLARGLEIAGDKAGALMYSDDIAYTEGLMLGPQFFRQFLFPLIGKIADLGRRYDLPLIYHSDGRLYPVFDDLHAIGVRAIQPLEPKSMDPLEIKQRWPGQFCLLGNIDLDLMARGQPDDVECHVRDKIDRLNATGGYMPGVSNTVPPYVKFENYIRMIETVHRYPDEPI